MKPLRALLLGLGILAALLAAVVALALTPAVQRWAVLRWAAGQPGLKLEADRISVGLTSVEIAGVRLEENGRRLRLDKLQGQIDLFRAVRGGGYMAREVRITGLEADLTAATAAVPPPTSAPAVAAAPVAPQLLAGLQLPVVLELDDVQAQGRVLLPGTAGGAPLTADFKVALDQFGPGREGKLRLDLTVRPGVAEAPVQLLSGSFGLRLVQSAERRFSQIELRGSLEAAGPRVAPGLRLMIDSTLAREVAAEVYAVRVGLQSAGKVEPLLDLDAHVPDKDAATEGTWRISARRDQLENFALGLALPAFATQGNGSFAISPGSGRLKLAGKVDLDLAELQTLDPAWKVFGALRSRSDFALQLQDGVMTLERLALSLSAEKPVLDLVAEHALRADFNTGALQVSPEGPAVTLDLKLQGVPLAWVGAFTNEVQVTGGLLTGSLKFDRPAGQKAAQVMLDVAAGPLNLAQAGRVLVTGGTAAVRARAQLTDQKVVAEQLAAEIKTAGGDAVTVTGRGEAGLAADSPKSAVLTVNATAAQLLALWLPGVAVQAVADLDVTWRDARLEVAPGRLALNQRGAEPFLVVRLPQRFVVNVADGLRVTAEQAARPVAEVQLARFPLAWVSAGAAGPRLAGELRDARLEVLADGTALSLRAPQPIVLQGFGLQQAAGPVLRGLQIACQPLGEFAAGSLVKFSLGDVLIRDETGLALVQATVDVSQPTAGDWRAALGFNSNLPALANQPVLAALGELSAGRASGEIRAAVAAGAVQVEARSTLNGLVLKNGAVSLPVANLSLKTVVQPDGSFTAQMPLLLDRAGRRSDLNFSAKGSLQGGRLNVDATLGSERIELEDVLQLAAGFSAAAPSAPPVTPAVAAKPVSVVKPDTAPAWAGVHGRLALDIKQITRGDLWSTSGLTGLLTVAPERIELRDLSAVSGPNGRLGAKGVVTFTPGTQPYRLDGSFELTEFDAGALLKALEPGQSPVVEGIFGVKSSFAGSGATLAQLAELTRGDFGLTSRAGVFRGLKRTSEKVSVATKAVELGAALGSLLGTSKVGKAAEKVAGQAYQVDQVAQTLGEFTYDQLSVHLVRDATLNIQLKEFALVSPYARLQGAGQVSQVEGKPLLEQPLTLTLALGARGKLEEQLGKLRVLDGTRDELDYARAREKVVLTGTLSRPDPTPFFTRLAAAKVSDLLDN